MLVLTRRENERIIFPDAQIAVELISINGARARIGIQAPSDVRVLREEIASDEDKAPRKRKSLSHAVRNRLNATSIAAQLLRRQLQHGMVAEADSTVRMLLEELGELNKEVLSGEGPAKGEGSLAASERRRALLVEDNANERQLLAGFLKMAGFEVDTAGDGEDALQYLASHDRPDVVLLDMYMPRVDGPTAIGEIRRDPRLNGMKVFAVSGTSPTQLGVATGPGGIDRWFNKPINPEELAREMARELIAPHQSA